MRFRTCKVPQLKTPHHLSRRGLFKAAKLVAAPVKTKNQHIFSEQTDTVVLYNFSTCDLLEWHFINTSLLLIYPIMGDSGEAQPTAIGTDEDPTRGRPYHDKVTQDLKTMLAKRRLLERNCVGCDQFGKFVGTKLTLPQSMMDEAIYKKETEYLEDTPYGNILIGFDNYIKGSSSSAPGGGRRKAGVDDSNRVFSRSSIRYNDVTVCPHSGLTWIHD